MGGRRFRLVKKGQRLAKTRLSVLRQQILPEEAGQDEFGQLVAVPFFEPNSTFTVAREEGL